MRSSAAATTTCKIKVKSFTNKSSLRDVFPVMAEQASWFVVKASIVEDGETHAFESRPMSRKAADREVAKLTAEGWTVAEIAPHTPASYVGPRGPKKLTARYEGACKDCGEYFAAGSTIYFMRETGALCSRCSARWYARQGAVRSGRWQG